MNSNKHYALVEELLIPNADKTDAPRLNMVCSHLSQFLTINDSEIPNVFTRFENQIGKYSSAHKTVNNITVIKKIIKNDNNFIYITVNNKNEYDIIHYASDTCLTENYGYKNVLVNDLVEGQEYKDDTLVYRNNMYDDNLNMKIGCNLKAVYLAYKGLTYEDAIVINETTAKRMSHREVNEIFVTLNNNDILINNYGGNKGFQPFPKVGQDVKNGILCTRRRINYATVLEDFKNNKLSSTINGDVNFYVDGTVVDIEVYSNIPDTERTQIYSEYLAYEEIFKIETEQKRYYTEINELISLIRESDPLAVFSDNLNYEFQKSIERSENVLPYSYDKNVFSGIVLKFRVVKDVPLFIGSKITNR